MVGTPYFMGPILPAPTSFLVSVFAVVLGKQTRQDPMKSRGFFYSHFEPALQVQTQYPSLHFPIFVPGPQNWNTCSLTRR